MKTQIISLSRELLEALLDGSTKEIHGTLKEEVEIEYDKDYHCRLCITCTIRVPYTIKIGKRYRNKSDVIEESVDSS